MPKRGSTKPIAGTHFYILLALSDQPRYGLGIVEEVTRRTDGKIQMGPGTLYNAVKKMLDDGLIAEWKGRTAGEGFDPRRRYYRITQFGRRVLRDEATRLERLLMAARDKRVLPST